MIQLNGKRFAATDAEMVESLFYPGGTCAGFYKRRADGVALLNLQRELVGVVNLHGVLCCATRLADGRYWYTHADIGLVGRYDSYARKVEECRAVLALVHGKPLEVAP